MSDTQQKFKYTKRGLAAIIALSLVLTVFTGVLFKIQVIDGEKYAAAGSSIKVKTVKVEGARGDILDRNGSPLITNRQGNSIIFDYSFFPSAKEQSKRNTIIGALIDMFERSGLEWIDSLPIVMSADGKSYVFAPDREKDIDELRTEILDLQNYATAQNCMDALIEKYELEAFDPVRARKIASVCYGMRRILFSVSAPYTFADDVPTEVVALIKENSAFFLGVDVDIVSYREYTDGTLMPHILGRVGLISAEEYNEKKEEGESYALNAVIGKEGIESAMEKYLRGARGVKTVSTDADGNVTTDFTIDPEQGNTVVLTIDKNLQAVAKDALSNGLEELREDSMVDPAGAIVIQDVNNGEILSSYSYPSYDVSTFSQDYNELREATNSPLWNRALMSTYSPGSTFKPCTAIAALEEGIITTETYFKCTRIHNYLNHKFQCLQPHDHLTMNVVSAINESCNIFFYNVAENTDIQTINKYATLLGLGQKTGVELPETSGRLDDPEYRASINQEWMPGFTLQNAIGNGGSMFSPVQLVNYCSTIANGGTRFRPHFVKTVKTSDYDATVIESEAEVVLETGISESTLNTVRRGMELVGSIGYCKYAFAHLPVKAAAKTGTSQVDRKINGVTVTTNNGFLITYAPVENPQIAICIAAEGAGSGSELAPIAAKVYDYYFNEMGTFDEPQCEGELLG